jgi:hypothetical protein
LIAVFFLGYRRDTFPCRYREILKQVQDDMGWTFCKGGTFCIGRAFRFAIDKDTIPRSEILNQVQDDEG